jgi:MFS family permease
VRDGHHSPAEPSEATDRSPTNAAAGLEARNLASSRSQGFWYFGGVGSWFAAAGIQSTLFPYLVAVVLAESARSVGIAQTLVMLPALLLILLGGAAADRADCRKLIVRLHLIAALPPLGLAAVIANDELSYMALVAYGLALSSIAAFVVPARDSLLSRVAGQDVQRAVIATMGIQNVSQIVGTALGGVAAALGAPLLLVGQSVMLAIGSIVSARLLPARPITRGARSSPAAQIRAGLQEVASSPHLRAATGLAIAIGLFFMGSFVVALPLLLRDSYDGSAPEIATSSASMMLGMLCGTVVLFARGGVQRQGRALILSLAAGAFVLASFGLAPPLAALYGLVFLFGAVGGVALPSARTLVQEAASEAQRARVLSVYSLGFMGAAPVGALSMGFLVEAFGAQAAMLPPAAAMLVTVTVTALTTDLWSYQGRGRTEPGSTDAQDAGSS